MISLLTNFNPRSHEGSDKISQPTITKYCLFQSTLPRGERLISRKKLVTVSRFQSTLPRGERPSAERLGGVLWDFNPRSHEGSDLCQGNCTLVQEISIHAPTRGATSIVIGRCFTLYISIHAPTRGATKLLHLGKSW